MVANAARIIGWSSTITTRTAVAARSRRLRPGQLGDHGEPAVGLAAGGDPPREQRRPLGHADEAAPGRGGPGGGRRAGPGSATTMRTVRSSARTDTVAGRAAECRATFVSASSTTR